MKTLKREGRERVKCELGLALSWTGKMGFTHWDWDLATGNGTGAHQMERPSPIPALGVNPFPSRFIIRTVPRGDFARRRWEEPITTTK